MECNLRARAREACGHGEVLLTLLKFSQVRGSQGLPGLTLYLPVPRTDR